MKRPDLLVLLAVWSSALAFDPLASEARLAALPPPGQVPLDAELVGGPECPAPGSEAARSASPRWSSGPSATTRAPARPGPRAACRRPGWASPGRPTCRP
jgi:hypothetical protein